MRYSQMRSMDISNGEGVGVSLFVQGCPIHCENCFNKETWSFDGGFEWDASAREKFVTLAGRPFITRVTILGGEPMAEENYEEVYSIIEEIRIKFPQKKIWVYSGFTEEYLRAKREHLFDITNVIIAGPFVQAKLDLGNRQTKWAGSTNQVVIRNDAKSG